MRGEAGTREMTVTLREAKTSNTLWTRQPDRQLIYFATEGVGTVRHAFPEVMLGRVFAAEFDAADIPVRDTFRGTTLDAPPPFVPRVETPDRHNPPMAFTTERDGPKRQTVGEWLDALALELAACEGSEEVDAVLARADVQSAQDKLRNGARDRLVDMIQVAIERTSPDETTAPNAGVFADEDPFREAAPA